MALASLIRRRGVWAKTRSTGGVDMSAPEQQGPCWAEPGTRLTYPLLFEAYRRTREAEDKPLPRHLTLGAATDRHVWNQWRAAPEPEVEVLLTMRADAPPRVRRMVAEVLHAIRRGRPAAQAIRRVSRRFGLRQSRTRACLAACLGFQVRAIREALTPTPTRACRSFPPPASDWM
jgi:hypothetical protein